MGDSIVGDAREELAEYVERGGRWPRVWYWLYAARLASGYLIHEVREVGVNAVWNDVRFGARSLAKMPGSAVVSVVVLAIGIGLCSSMFSVVYGLYFRGLNVPDSEEILHVYATDVEENELQNPLRILDFVDWRERQRSFDGLFASYFGTLNVSGPGEPVRFQGAHMSANAFSLLGVPPLLGRVFVEGDDVPGAPPLLVLGHDAWRDTYGSDPAVIGREVRVNGEPGTIIGVMPDGFEFPYNTEAWVPIRVDPYAAPRAEGRWVLVYGRLADGVDRDVAEAEMVSIAEALAREHPESNEGIGARLETMVAANMEPALNLVFSAMMVAVLFVLLVACANVANLLLARAAMRTREAGVRVALGASRLRVMLPFLAEALVLASVGALLGIGIAYLSVGWFDGVTDPSRTGRPWFMQFKIDLPILLFVVGLTGLTALVAGIAPAWQLSRTDVHTVLKDESRGSSSLRIGRITRVLVTAEVALSCALLVGAGLIAKSIVNIASVEHAYETDRLFTARASLFPADYPDRDARLRLWDDLLREVHDVPGVAAAALTSGLPYDGSVRRRISIDRRDLGEEADPPSVNRAVVSEGYFAALGVALVAGRDFTEEDDIDVERVAIVNQPMVDRYFDGGDPIGRLVYDNPDDSVAPAVVIGVAPDLDMEGATPPGFPGWEPAGYYVSLRQGDPSAMSLAVMPAGGAAMAVTPDVRAAVRRVDPNLPLYDVRSQSEVVDQAIWFYSAFGTVFIAFGLAALFMASVGLYGVLSFGVTRRTSEMGIRMALGAGSGQVVRLVARQGAGQLGLGLLLGTALAFGLTRLLSLLMYDVDPQDPVVFGGVIAVIVLVGMAAAVFPALRATTVDPVEALRQE